MQNLTIISDDMTGAADSGSYFTDRGQELTIFTSLENDFVRHDNVIISINLSTRNTSGDVAKTRHYNTCMKIKSNPNQIIMKEIGTGFRGNDSLIDNIMH